MRSPRARDRPPDDPLTPAQAAPPCVEPPAGSASVAVPVVEPLHVERLAAAVLVIAGPLRLALVPDAAQRLGADLVAAAARAADAGAGHG